MIENREIMMRMFPELFEKLKIETVENYPTYLLEVLKTLTPIKCENEPKIVILTPGSFNSAYYEHSFLADLMGSLSDIDIVKEKFPNGTPVHDAFVTAYLVDNSEDFKSLAYLRNSSIFVHGYNSINLQDIEHYRKIILHNLVPLLSNPEISKDNLGHEINFKQLPNNLEEIGINFNDFIDDLWLII